MTDTAHVDWFTIWTVAARRVAGLSDSWFGYIGTAAKGGGIIVTGAECPPITRGPRKGSPNWRKPVPGTRYQVFVSSDLADRVRDEMKATTAP